MNSKLYERLYDKICELPVIDTHEHLFYGGDLTGQKDILKEYLVQYLSSDIISAGFLREQLNRVTDEKIDIAERWKIVEPYWEACRYTGYGQALDTAVKKIYGVKKISGKTI